MTQNSTSVSSLRLLEPDPERPLPAPRIPKNFFARELGYDLIEQALELKVGREEADYAAQDGSKPYRPSKFAELLALMRAPEHQALWTAPDPDLTPLMRSAQVNLFDIFQLMTDYWAAMHAAKKAKVKLDSAAGTMQEFFADVAQDAIGRYVPCTECNDGSVPLSDGAGGTMQIPCDRCKGSGKQWRGADSKSRDQYIKIHGLDDAKTGGSSAPTTVNVTAQAAAKADSGSDKKSDAPPALARVDAILGR